MQAYIDLVSEHILWERHELRPDNLQAIGEFTRENIAKWLDSHDKHGIAFETGVYGWKDFHAACDDIDIPWATEEARSVWTKAWQN